MVSIYQACASKSSQAVYSSSVKERHGPAVRDIDMRIMMVAAWLEGGLEPQVSNHFKLSKTLCESVNSRCRDAHVHSAIERKLHFSDAKSVDSALA